MVSLENEFLKIGAKMSEAKLRIPTYFLYQS